MTDQEKSEAGVLLSCIKEVTRQRNELAKLIEICARSRDQDTRSLCLAVTMAVTPKYSIEQGHIFEKLNNILTLPKE